MFSSSCALENVKLHICGAQEFIYHIQTKEEIIQSYLLKAGEYPFINLVLMLLSADTGSSHKLARAKFERYSSLGEKYDNI